MVTQRWVSGAVARVAEGAGGPDWSTDTFRVGMETTRPCGGGARGGPDSSSVC